MLIFTITMNLKKYEKLRKKFGSKPVGWLDGNVLIQNFCKNHQIKYVYQMIDTDLIYTTHLVFVLKVFLEIISALKKKLELILNLYAVVTTYIELSQSSYLEQNRKQNLETQMRCSYILSI